MPASHPAGSTYPQEGSSLGALGPHCPMGLLAPRFSRQALPPPGVPCPETTLGSPLPGRPWLTPCVSHPGPMGTSTSFSVCYGLNCHSRSALGSPWGQTVCANVQHAGKRLQTIPETNSNDDQGPGCPSLPHAPSVPGFILPFPALSYPLPHVSLLSPHPPTVMTH